MGRLGLVLMLAGADVASDGAKDQFINTFNFTDGVSGKIKKIGSTYTATTGWAAVQISRNVITGALERGFMQFDTSSIPDNATITLVELLIILSSTQPANAPDAIEVLIGNWIGASLDASAADFDGGNHMFYIDLPTQDNTWYDLAQDGYDPKLWVNRSGTTDIAIRDVSTGILTTGQDYNTSKLKCKLRVTYDA